MVRKIGMGQPRRDPRQEKASRLKRWEDYLEKDEELLWEGAPAGGIRFHPAGLLKSAFGVFFLGVSMGWVSMEMQSNLRLGPSINLGIVNDFPVIGLPFVLAGLWMVVGVWIFDAYLRKRTRYAVTTKRAIIANTVFGNRMKSYPISADSPIGWVKKGGLDMVNFYEIPNANGKGRLIPLDFAIFAMQERLLINS